MTQYFTDFADSSVGAQPAGWTEQWVTGSGQAIVVDSGLPAGSGPRAVRLTLSTSGRYALSWDVPGVVTGDVEVVYRAHYPSVASASRRRLIVHGSGTAGSETAYFIEETAGLTGLREYPAVSTIGSDGPAAPAGWVWWRLQRTGTTLRYRFWADGAEEPTTWLASGTDTTLTSGWVGFGSFAASGLNAIHVDVVGVGTGTDPAPTSSLEEPAPAVTEAGDVPESALTGHRREDYWVDVLTPSGGVVRRLDGVTSLTVEENVHADVAGTGSLTLHRRGDEDVQWLSQRLRVWWSVDGHAWPLGTYLPVAPTAVHDLDESPQGPEYTPVWTVTLMDLTTVLAQRQLDETLSVPAGSVVTTVVTTLVTGLGEQVAVTPSPETLVEPQSWPPGTSYLRVVNDLLATINYFSVRADGLGRLSAHPYRAPTSRAITRTFTPGNSSLHLPSITRDEDIFSVPNKVILRTQGDEATEGLVSVAVHDDPDDPLSTVNRITISVTEEVEATSQAVLDQMAAARLDILSRPRAELEITHAVVPLKLNDVVAVDLDHRRYGVVQAMTTDVQVGGLTRTTILEVTI